MLFSVSEKGVIPIPGKEKQFLAGLRGSHQTFGDPKPWSQAHCGSADWRLELQGLP